MYIYTHLHLHTTHLHPTLIHPPPPRADAAANRFRPRCIQRLPPHRQPLFSLSFFFLFFPLLGFLSLYFRRVYVLVLSCRGRAARLAACSPYDFV